MIIKKKKTISVNNDTKPIEQEIQPQVQPEAQQESLKAEIEQFDALSNITERQERRRGDRRRGYRRIEDRSLVSRAHEEAKLIKEQAEKDGFADGIAHADEEIKQLQEAITYLLGVKQEAYEYYKKDIIDISMEIAKKILAEQVSVNPDTIVEIATNVIKEISEDDNKITFIINSQDELVLKENLETNSAFKNKRATMSIETDDRIERGSCKVVTNSGQIDATFSSQLNIIQKAFQEGLK